MDEHIPPKEGWDANHFNEVIPNDVLMDNTTWTAKRDTWAQQMLYSYTICY
jgi:hypothetical protein